MSEVSRWAFLILLFAPHRNIQESYGNLKYENNISLFRTVLPKHLIKFYKKNHGNITVRPGYDDKLHPRPG